MELAVQTSGCSFCFLVFLFCSQVNEKDTFQGSKTSERKNLKRIQTQFQNPQQQQRKETTKKYVYDDLLDKIIFF